MSPIAVFCYRRPYHLNKVLESLSKSFGIENTEVFIFCDGPKSNKDIEELNSVNEVRIIASSFKAGKKNNVIISENNLGLNASIEKGINHVFNLYEKIIVLEDDIIVSKGFLDFMNNALNIYNSDDRVYHISGYTPFTGLSYYRKSTFFMKTAQIWGWGTWKNKWQIYFRDPEENYKIITKNKKMTREYNFHDSINYIDLLKKTVHGDKTIWDTKWSSSLFVMEKFSLYPFKSLVKNIGLDNSGIHCKGNSSFFFKPNLFEMDNYSPDIIFQKEVYEEIKIREQIKVNLSKAMGRRYYYFDLLKNFLNVPI